MWRLSTELIRNYVKWLWKKKVNILFLRIKKVVKNQSHTSLAINNSVGKERERREEKEEKKERQRGKRERKRKKERKKRERKRKKEKERRRILQFISAAAFISLFRRSPVSSRKKMWKFFILFLCSPSLFFSLFLFDRKSEIEPVFPVFSYSSRTDCRHIRRTGGWEKKRKKERKKEREKERKKEKWEGERKNQEGRNWYLSFSLRPSVDQI